MDIHDELIRIPLDATESLTVRVTCREGVTPGRLLALFPPHPSLGGDAENNVIRALARAGVERGRFVLRLRYRRTDPGDSGDGRPLAFWDDLDARQNYGLVETDSLHAVETVRQMFRLAGPIEIAAYSFGVYVALRVLGRVGPARLVGISPPLVQHDFVAALPAAGTPGRVILVGANGDPFCPPRALRDLARVAEGRAHLFETGDHFYRGEEDRLANLALKSLPDEF